MEENKKDYYSLPEIIEIIKSLSNYLFRRWWIILLITIIGSVLGVIYYYIQKPKYEAVTTFVLEDKSAGGSGLAGLASQFGFNLGSLSGGTIFSGDNILDILKSKKIVQQVLLSSSDAEGNSLADLYLDFSELKKKWRKRPSLAKINFKGLGEQHLSPVQDSVLNDVYKRILKNNLVVDHLNKKGSIIEVKVVAINEIFARLMSERLVKAASKLYFDIRTGTSQENIRQLQRRSDSLLVLLNQKSFTAAATQPVDINPGLRTAVVPTEIATRDKTVLATLYAEVTKNLEASKLLLSQQTPVMELLDTPGELLDDNKKGLFFLVIIFSLGGLGLGVAILSGFYFGKSSNRIRPDKGNY